MSNKKNKHGVCKFCGLSKKLVDSHIIPKGLYWGLKDGNGKVAQLVSPFEGEYQKKRPIGIYDQFLCGTCEEQFNPWDTYAITLLRDTEPITVDDGWRFEQVDYVLLKLFFISLLWRAQAADDSFFNIDLGPHGERLKKHITEKNPGIPDEYAVLLGKSEELLAKGVIDPKQERHYDINFTRFYFPGYVALIKVDKRPLPTALKQYSLNRSGSWFVQRKQFKGKMEEKMIMQTAETNWKRKYGEAR